MIYIRDPLDLDSACAVWAIRQFCDKNAGFRFRPPNWDGVNFKEGDVAVNLEAGGKGMKREWDEDDKAHTFFVYILRSHATNGDIAALGSVIPSVEASPENGMLITTGGVIDLLLIFKALQSGVQKKKGRQRVVVARIGEILSGVLQRSRALQHVIANQYEIEMAEGEQVALVFNTKVSGMTRLLLERHKLRAAVYVAGNNIGVVRAEKEEVRMDHPDIKAVPESVGEKWFSEMHGTIFAHGTRNCPARRPSRVDPHELVAAVARVLAQAQQ